jgi:hypothetical protein
MHLKASLVVLGTVGALGFGCAPAIASPSATVFLDSYDALSTGATTPISSPAALVNGQHYLISVEGTFSAWTHWPSRRCGKVEPAPVYLSPGRPDAPTGDDAEFRFARPAFTRAQCNRHELPKSQVVFQLDTGTGWHHPIPVGGPASEPTRHHRYVYDVVGTGVPVQFRLVDWETRDNNGRLKIAISAAP